MAEFDLPITLPKLIRGEECELMMCCFLNRSAGTNIYSMDRRKVAQQSHFSYVAQYLFRDMILRLNSMPLFVG